MNKKNTSPKNGTQQGAARPFTSTEVKKMFTDYGITISSFCAQHQLSRMSVVDLLRGEGKGRRGDSHRAAVLLGMKPCPRTKMINHPFEKLEIAA